MRCLKKPSRARVAVCATVKRRVAPPSVNFTSRVSTSSSIVEAVTVADGMPSRARTDWKPFVPVLSVDGAGPQAKKTSAASGRKRMDPLYIKARPVA
jgi:hypothetical protein